VDDGLTEYCLRNFFWSLPVRHGWLSVGDANN